MTGEGSRFEVLLDVVSIESSGWRGKEKGKGRRKEGGVAGETEEGRRNRRKEERKTLEIHESKMKRMEERDGGTEGGKQEKVKTYLDCLHNYI